MLIWKLFLNSDLKHPWHILSLWNYFVNTISYSYLIKNNFDIACVNHANILNSSLKDIVENVQVGNSTGAFRVILWQDNCLS